MRAVFFLFRHEVVGRRRQLFFKFLFRRHTFVDVSLRKVRMVHLLVLTRTLNLPFFFFFELIRFISLVAGLSRRLVVGRCFFLLFHLANFWRFFVHELFWAAPNAGNRHTGDTFWPRVASDIFIRIQLESVWNFDILDDNHAFFVIRLWRVSFRFRLGFRLGFGGSFSCRFLSLLFFFIDVDIRDELYLLLRHTVRFDIFWHVLCGDGVIQI